MGRPTKLTPELKATANTYLDVYKDLEHAVPSAQGLAIFLGVSEGSLYNWGDKDPEFLGTLDDIQTRQHFQLVNCGLTNDFNSAITKLMLANHGHSEKLDQTISCGNKPLEIKGTTWIYEGVKPEATD